MTTVVTDVAPATAMKWSAGEPCVTCGQPVSNCPECGQALPKKGMKKNFGSDMASWQAYNKTFNAMNGTHYGEPKKTCATCGQSTPAPGMNKGFKTDIALGTATVGIFGRTPPSAIAHYLAGGYDPPDCPTCGQKKPKVLKADGIEDDLAKMVAANPMDAAFVAGDFVKIGDLWHNEATRPQAEAMLKAWIEQGGALRKAMSTAWLARARGALEGLARRVGGRAAGRGPTLAIRGPSAQPRIEAEAGPSPRLEAPAHSSAADHVKLAGVSAKYGFKAGKQAVKDFAAGAARGGREMGLTAPRAAVGAAGSAAGYAAASSVRHHALSEKEIEERRNAGKQRWANRGRPE